jgi:trigger factor
VPRGVRVRVPPSAPLRSREFGTFFFEHKIKNDMNVIRQEIDALNGLLIVEINPTDYSQKVKNTLEKHRKTANIPGFRPGHTPAGIIEKRYGKAVLAETLNTLANESVYGFIRENSLDILGNAIPSATHAMEGSFDQPGTFKFTYEIGMAPTFDYQSVLTKGIEYHTVRVDDNLVSQQIEDIQRRYGKMISVDEAGPKDLVVGTFTELEADGTVKPEGISHSTTLSIEFIENLDAKQSLIGKKLGDQFSLDPSTVSKDDADKASLLGLTPETLPSNEVAFEFKITDIKRMELAELTADLFAKLFQDGEITDEAGLRARLSKDLEQMFERDADRLMTRKVYDALINDVKMTFPEPFLKRWIKLSATTPIADEDIEKEFEAYLKSLKWQLIQTKIFKDSDTKLVYEEVLAFTKGLLISNYAQYGIPAPEDAELEASARELLTKKEQANSIYDQLAEEKLTQYFKTNASLKMKPLSYDDFLAEMKK